MGIVADASTQAPHPPDFICIDLEADPAVRQRNGMISCTPTVIFLI
jgi:hypothetical protein